ncbi:MAG: PASTA domain-containing protein [Oscillospiraceae bacterium]|nr:PASTA domain-containing protein [Oscillospiraceae bacterium]
MQDPKRTPRKGDHGRSNRSLFRRTIFLMVVLGIGMFLPLVAQLYRLQIVEHAYWEEQADRQQTKSVPVTSNRGTIYDCEGRILAMNATVYKLILSPVDVYRSVKRDAYPTEAEYTQALYDKRKLIVDWVVDTFGYDGEKLWKRIENIKSAYSELYTELEDEDAEKVREFTSKNKISNMLYVTPASKRYYPFSSVGSHVLGFMNQNESSGENKVGAQGIELMYEDTLSGSLGRVVTSKNGIGMEMISGYEMYFDAEDGCDVTLTLDERIQAMLEQALAEGIETYDIQNGAFGIVMEPKTGAVLGMASTPDFDPNNWGAILDEDTLAELQKVADASGTDSDEYKKAWKTAWNKQMKNRALSDTYEPGSVFKPLTVAMALEEGVVSLNDHFYCGGGKVVAGQNISCHRKAGHLDQDLTHVVMNSCNVGLMDIAEKMGPDIMWKYFEDFGLFDKTGIDLIGEGKQQFWTEEYFKGPYGVQSVATSSFGQTFTITPIQMITAFASVINGGHLLEPYVVESIADGDGNTVYYHETTEVRQVISESTSEKVRGILEQVVGSKEGSGHNASMSGYRIGGKTGTSENIAIKAIDKNNNDVMCSFMGFAPADDPQVLVLLVYDTPKRAGGTSNYLASGTYISGGNIAAPMAGRLIASILDYMGIERQYSADELLRADTAMPKVVGHELAEAKSSLESVGFQCRTVGTGSVVQGQVPSAGVSIPGGSTVILYLGEDAPTEQVEVPSLAGLSPAKSKEKLEAMGLFMRAAGVVDYNDPKVMGASQSIAAGTLVSVGTVVEVRFVSSVAYGDHQ